MYTTRYIVVQYVLYIFFSIVIVKVMFMKCIICGKEIEETDDVCKECDKLIDMFYRKRPEDKEMALQIFREESKNEDST